MAREFSTVLCDWNSTRVVSPLSSDLNRHAGELSPKSATYQSSIPQKSAAMKAGLRHCWRFYFYITAVEGSEHCSRVQTGSLHNGFDLPRIHRPQWRD